MLRLLTQAFLVNTLLCLLTVLSVAQVDRVYRSVRVLSDKEIQIAAFARANTNECKPLPLPQIHVISSPEHGSLTVRSAFVTTKADQKCPGLRIPAQVLLYKSISSYVGNDIVSFTVTFENGVTQIHQISLTVAKEGEATKPEEL
jgi:hypothetical protein